MSELLERSHEDWVRAAKVAVPDGRMFVDGDHRRLRPVRRVQGIRFRPRDKSLHAIDEHTALKTTWIDVPPMVHDKHEEATEHHSTGA
jgi:hypothetical protein